MQKIGGQNKMWAVALLMVCTFFSYWNIFLLSPLQPYIAADLDITIGQAAQLTTVSAAASIVSLVAFGLWGSRVPRKNILLLGMISLTIGSFLLTATDSFRLMLVFRVFNGLSDGLIYPAALVLVTEYLEEKEHSKGITAIVVGTGLSAVVGIPLTIGLLDTENWQESFELFAWFSVLGILAAALLPAANNLKQKSGKGFRVLFTNKRLRSIASANIAGDIAWFGTLTFLGSFLFQAYNPNLTQLALLYFGAGLSFVAGSALSIASSFSGQRRLAIGSSLVSAVLAPLFFAFSEGYGITLGIALVFAFFRAPGIATMDTMLLSVAENTTTRVVSAALSSVIAGIAVFVAALVGGLVLDSSTYAAIGLAFGACAFISVLFLWKLQPESTPTSSNNTLAKEPSIP